MELIIDLGIIFVIASIFGLIIRQLGLPLIVAYIMAGVLLGDNALKIVTDRQIIENLSTLGIVLMLFIVGLELDWKKARDFARSATVIGIGQIIITGIVGYFIANYFGFSSRLALYTSLTLTFSSTVIVIKLLSDKRDLNSLYGRISLGVLLIQDIVAILALILLQTTHSEFDYAYSLALAVIKLGALCIMLYFSQKIVQKIFKSMAESSELLLISSIGWAFLIALISYQLNFGLEIGAFLAGIFLATLPYRLEITAKIKSIRDFFVTLFFVTLGLNFSLDFESFNFSHASALIVFVILGQTIITMIIMGFLGFRKRTSFQTALALSQVSEFSFIIISLGLLKGDLSQPEASLLMFVGIATIIISTILIENTDAIYYHIGKYLKIFEKKSGTLQNDSINIPSDFSNHIVIFGADHIGKRILASLFRQKQKILVVDFNPAVIKELQENEIPAVYGDMGDPEFIVALGLERCQLVISTTHDFYDNMRLVKKINFINRNCKIYVLANNPEKAIEFYRAGVERVVLPSNLTGDMISELIGKSSHYQRFNIQKHIKELKIQSKKIIAK